jgi:hypothetical protein
MSLLADIRRQVVPLLLGTSIVGALVGCGGGGGGTADSETNAHANIDRLVVGAGTLTPIGSEGRGQPTSDATCSLSVIPQAAHIVGLERQDGDPAALAFAIPNEPIRFDAESTAEALVIMSPGVLTQRPNEAIELHKSLRTRDSFRVLVNRLRAQMQTGGLVQAMNDPEVVADLETVLGELLGTRGTVITQRNMHALVNVDAALKPDGGVQGKASSAELRYFTVIRRTTDSSGNVSVVKIDDLPGMELPDLFSTISNLFTGSLPEEGEMAVDTSPDVASAEFYLFGWGTDDSAVAVPADVRAKLAENPVHLADVKTAWMYGVAPIAGAFGELVTNAGSLSDIAEAAMAAETVRASIVDLHSAMASQDNGRRLRAVRDLSLVLLQASINDSRVHEAIVNHYLRSGLNSRAATQAAGRLIGKISFWLKVANTGVALGQLESIRRAIPEWRAQNMFSYQIFGDGTVVIR